MSKIVPAEDIERIVGVERRPSCPRPQRRDRDPLHRRGGQRMNRADRRAAGQRGPTRPARTETQPTPVWYGVCRHWTERWDVLVRTPHGIPACPIDGAVGFHADETWWPSVDEYEADGHPGYRAEVEALRIGGRLADVAVHRA